jgi:glutamate formiminotransferase / 5-formyltetrahydrofolate cyclo-ligase
VARPGPRSYPGPVLECVVNISEGRRTDVLDRLARATGPALLDVHADPDHHRSVFTLAHADPVETEGSARRLATAAAEVLSLADHDGVHPRLGVIDVVPFVSLAPTPTATSVTAARAFADWIGAALEIPAFLYDLADADGRTLPEVRRDAFSSRAPDAGPGAPHPRLGATAVGAREVLVAVNLELGDDDVQLARAVARQVRARDGGLPGVRALGLALPSRGRAQVSMNLVDLEVTGLEAACVAARDRIEGLGGTVRRVELVGLVPAAVLEAAGAEFLAWSGLGPTDTVEGRAATAMGGGAAWAGGPGGSTRGEGPVPGA